MTFWLEVGEPGISRVFSLLDHSATTNIDSFDYTPLFLLTLSLLFNLNSIGCQASMVEIVGEGHPDFPHKLGRVVICHPEVGM